MRIFLIGYMGSGKSSVGKVLAEKMKLSFVDLDDHIEEQEKRTIPEIFEKDGEKKFRELEKKYLHEVVKRNHTIVSLGGGTPCFFDNMDVVNRSGISVYIKLDNEALGRRLAKAKKKRPLIQDMTEVDLQYFIEANLEKREPFYLRSKIIVTARELDPQQLADRISAEVGKLQK